MAWPTSTGPGQQFSPEENSIDALGAGTSAPAARTLAGQAVQPQARTGKAVARFLRRKAVHFYLLVGITLLTVLVRSTSAERYARERRDVELKARAQRTRELVAFWSTLNFSSGERTPDELVRRIDWNSLPLSDLQKQAAQRRVRDAVAYLLHPTFDVYYRLKTENLHYSFSLDRRAGAILGWTNAVSGTPAPGLAAVALWEAVIPDRKANEAPRLTAVSLDRAAAIVTTNGLPGAMLGGRLWKAVTVAYAAPNPGFRYEGSAREKPLFLNLSFYARSSTSTNPGPVHLSLVWSEPDRNWALHRMLTDVQLRLDTLF